MDGSGRSVRLRLNVKSRERKSRVKRRHERVFLASPPRITHGPSWVGAGGQPVGRGRGYAGQPRLDHRSPSPDSQNGAEPRAKGKSILSVPELPNYGHNKRRSGFHKPVVWWGQETGGSHDCSFCFILFSCLLSVFTQIQKSPQARLSQSRVPPSPGAIMSA